MRPLNLENNKYHDLTVIRLASVNRNQGRYWECKCDCGNLTVLSTDHLTRKKNPVKSCGCKQISRGPTHVQWEGYGEISKSWWTIHITRELSTGNNRHRVNCSITIQEGWELFLKQNRKCALSGVDLKFALKGTANSASLDRIDSSKGYELGNVQWVHKHVNFMKRDFEQNYFIDMCKKIVNTKS
jgi:hypothetical protein